MGCHGGYKTPQMQAAGDISTAARASAPAALLARPALMHLLEWFAQMPPELGDRFPNVDGHHKRRTVFISVRRTMCARPRFAAQLRRMPRLRAAISRIQLQLQIGLLPLQHVPPACHYRRKFVVSVVGGGEILQPRLRARLPHLRELVTDYCVEAFPRGCEVTCAGLVQGYIF